MFLIYGLRDPRTGEIRYVGQTKKGIRRAHRHRCPDDTRRSPPRKRAWLEKIRRLGLRPEAIVLQVVDQAEDLNAAEQAWIAIARAALGRRCVNATPGGDRVDPRGPLSEAQRAKLAEAGRRRYADPAERRRQSWAQRAQHVKKGHPRFRLNLALRLPRPEKTCKDCGVPLDEDNTYQTGRGRCCACHGKRTTTDTNRRKAAKLQAVQAYC